jgi:DNA-binding response OmpR family regulator
MSSAHILVIDDDPDLQEVITLMLESAGHRVSQAPHGARALELVARELPALILLDMKMPVMDGWAFATEFHARHGHQVPLVVLTAAEDARLRAQETGADAWLGKPFDLEVLLATVERLLLSRTARTCRAAPAPDPASGPAAG